MNITIATLDRNATNGGVIVVHWIATLTDGEFTASVYGTESFTPDPEAPGFIAYDDLTEADVIGWLNERWGEEGIAAKQAALEADIERQKNPPVLSDTPWSN